MHTVIGVEVINVQRHAHVRLELRCRMHRATTFQLFVGDRNLMKNAESLPLGWEKRGGGNLEKLEEEVADQARLSILTLNSLTA